MKSVQNKKIYFILFLLVNVLFLFYMQTYFTSNKIDADASENLEFGYNLYRYGIFGKSSDVFDKPTPTNLREPVPPVVNAVFMFFHPDFNKQISFEEIQEGRLTKRMKQVNLFWILFLLVGLGYFVYLISGKIWLAFISWILVIYYFIHFGGNHDILYTELPTAGLIIWCSIYFYKSLHYKNKIDYMLLGACTGLLILTKVAFFYLSVPVLIVLFWMNTSGTEKIYTLYSLLGIIFVVGPWMVRNYIHFDEFSIVGSRGGKAIYSRVLFNQMSQEEVKGAIYLWGPKIYKDLVSGSFLGAAPSDFELNGKYEKLIRFRAADSVAVFSGTPEDAIGYFYKSKAVEEKLTDENVEGGLRKDMARHEANKKMKSESVNWILRNPIQHTYMSPVFLWRGVWCFPNSTIPFISNTFQIYIHNIVNALSFIMLFFLFLYGFIKKNDAYLAVSIFPTLMVIFYVGASHCLPRYFESIIPSLLVAFSLSTYLFMNRFIPKKKV